MHRCAFNAVVHLTGWVLLYPRNAGYWRAVEVQVTRVRRRWWWQRRWLATTMRSVQCVCMHVCIYACTCVRLRAQSDTCAVAQKMTVIRVIILVLKKEPISLSRRSRPSRHFRLRRAFRSAARLRTNGTEWIGDRCFFTRAFRGIRWFLLTGTRDPRAITKDRMYLGRRGNATCFKMNGPRWN